ncbi:phosphatase PAP2 family protein [Rhizobium sp. G21]|uniref:phosphatase PAP2 family protein n=1 Tax=Rhizobium sp. G21 TaxID=2758439 RepID=UPI001602B3B6|nr:phosphatase PAP2 family protein [Rhizobium sp. G21]MBB1249517.1 phosphatase PAP2 family protein [Rhizobium sp. G21]
MTMTTTPRIGFSLAELRATGLLRPYFALPLIVAVSVIMGLQFDAWAGGQMGRWPVWLSHPSRLMTDYVKSGWILWSSAALIVTIYVSYRDMGGGAVRDFTRRLIGAAAFVFASVAVSGLGAMLLKNAIGRARPALFSEAGAFAFRPFEMQFFYQGFPSGHGTTAGAFFTALAILYPRYWLIWTALGVVLASTRVFVGAHYPSDATAGFLLGAWFAFAIACIFHARGWWPDRRRR